MYIRDFDSTSDLTHINHWLSIRQLPMVPISDIPKIGSVFCHGGHPVAAVFLRLCEGNIGIIDSLITDPDQDAGIRNKANTLLTLDLIEKAKSLKLSGLIAWTKDNNTLVRALGLGFRACEDLSVISMDLRKAE